MNRVFLYLVAGTLGLVAAAAAAEGPSARAVLPPTRRIEALKLAERVLAPRAPDWKVTTAEVPDPFYRTNFTRPAEEQVAEVVPQNTRSDLDILQQAAADIRPTGIMAVDGENYLLMGGKRYKTGAVLSVTIDGLVHSITINAIEGKSYSLRLNEQELRQQLK